MANRTVFNIFGSIGPAGALVSVTERACTAFYPKAYAYGDPESQESQIDKDLKTVREEYINELFRIKSKFTRNAAIEAKKGEAYKDLIELINKYIDKTVRLSKNKYMRERIFY